MRLNTKEGEESQSPSPFYPWIFKGSEKLVHFVKFIDHTRLCHRHLENKWEDY